MTTKHLFLRLKKKNSTPTKLGCTLWERTSQTRSLVEAEEQITNNKLCKTSIEKLPICSHIYSGGMFLKGLFPGTRKKKKKGGKTHWRNETTTSPSPPTGAEREPTLRNFTSFTPTPQAIRPSPPRKKKKKKKKTALFLKMLVEEASAVAIELLLGSQGWIPVSDVMHSLISWQDPSDWDKSVEITVQGIVWIVCVCWLCLLAKRKQTPGVNQRSVGTLRHLESVWSV